MNPAQSCRQKLTDPDKPWVPVHTSNLPYVQKSEPTPCNAGKSAAGAHGVPHHGQVSRGPRPLPRSLAAERQAARAEAAFLAPLRQAAPCITPSARSKRASARLLQPSAASGDFSREEIFAADERGSRRDRRCHRANQPAAPKHLSAFICVHPRQNTLAFRANTAALAVRRSRPPRNSPRPAQDPATFIDSAASLRGRTTQAPRRNAVHPEHNNDRRAAILLRPGSLSNLPELIPRTVSRQQNQARCTFGVAPDQSLEPGAGAAAPSATLEPPTPAW